MQTVQVDGAELAVDRAGDGAPILLIGGTGEPMVAWEMSGMIAALVESGRQVVWFAARGVSPSGSPALPWTVDDLAADGFAVLDALGIVECTLVGYSLGGFTAEVMARSQPDRISGVVLLGSAGRLNTLTRAMIDSEVALAETYGHVPKEYSRMATFMTVLSQAELGDEALSSQWWELLDGQADVWDSREGEVGQVQASASWAARDPSTPWPESVPAAIIAFEQDPMFTVDAAREVAPRLGASVLTVPNAAHGGLLTHPEATIEAVMEALEALHSR